MHEMSIADDILRQTLALVAEHDAVCVDEIEVEVGVLRLIVPEFLVEAWGAISDGTLAAGASLKITEIPARAKCRQCGHTHDVDVEHYACPECSQADAQILQGDGIILKSIACRTREEKNSDED